MAPVSDSLADLGTPDVGSDQPIDPGSADLYSAVGDALNAADDAPLDDGAGLAAPTDGQPALDGQPAADSNAPAIPYQLTPDGASYMVPKADFASMNGLRTYAESVQNYFPTAQDAKSAYENSSDYRALFHDFLNGSDQDMDAVLGTLAGADATDPQARAQFQQSFSRMMTRAPELLRQINNQAYEQMADGVMQANIQAAYQQAASTGQPQDLEYAQRLDWGWNGKYTTDLQRPDPASYAQQQLQQRELAIAAREKAIQDNSWSSFDRSLVNGPRWQGFNTEIDKTLEPAKSKHDPLVFEAIRDRIRTEAIKKLDSDSDWARGQINEWKAIEVQFRRYGDTPSLRSRIQTYNNDFSARVRRYIPSIAAPLLTNAAKTKVSTQPNAQRPVAQTAPASSPNPAAARTSAPQPQRAQNGRFIPPREQLEQEMSQIFKVI
jgi:hypothetical protein